MGNNLLIIERKLMGIINNFLPVDHQIDLQSSCELRDKCLHLIITNSQHAILFISMIEDEFEIEFQDKDLTLDNLLSFKSLCALLSNTY